jgi:AraC-like DNA-binding protein
VDRHRQRSRQRFGSYRIVAPPKAAVRQFRLAFGESPYAYLMTRRIERAMALLRRGELSVTEVCFAVGCASLGSFSGRFTELVGVAPSVYRRQAAVGLPPCVARQVTRPVRKQAAPVPGPRLA